MPSQTTDSQGDTPADPDPQAGPPADGEPASQPDDADDEAWANSSWDLRQGLDVSELNELPAEWGGTKPR